MSPNRSTYREPVRMPSRPMHDRGRSQYSGSMAYNGKGRRPRGKRRIGRKILALLVLCVIAWFGRNEIIGTVQGWLDMIPGIDSSAKILAEEAAPENESIQVETESENEMTQKDSVNRAGLMSKAENWLEDRLSNVFKVQAIELSGNRSLSDDSLLSGLENLQGSPLLDVDPPSLADSMRLHPRIQDVVVGRQFPSTVTVEVSERHEIAVLISNGGVWGIDESRVVLPLPGRAWPLDLPVISGLGGDPVPGSSLTNEAIIEAMDWVTAVSELPRMQAWLSEIHISGNEIAWISGEDGRVVLPGEHDVIAQVATLDAFLASKDKADGRIVDLSFPDYLIVRDEPWSATDSEEG
jgi:cell division protein FtsQ